MDNLTDFSQKLSSQHLDLHRFGGLRAFAVSFAQRLLGLLFPHFRGERAASAIEISEALEHIAAELKDEIAILAPESNASSKAQSFLTALPHVHASLLLDAQAIVQGDPAAKSIDEVILCYPGFLATAIYRIAHELTVLEIPLLPRVLTEYAHSETGIDIHPGASIGSSFCIDHGTGMVIGETTIIKDNVRIYQGVTLGGLVVNKGLANQKRHPTIEENVVIYANATILGGETTIGAGSVIGGNVWITSSVPPGSMVYHKGEITVRKTSGGLS